MTTKFNNQPELNHIISCLNHKITGNLARLEGLYLLYKEEGTLRNDLWEEAFLQARQETHTLLAQSFALYQSQNESLQVA